MIGRWRQDLLNELDYVGFTVALDGAGRLSVSHALRRKRRESELLADESTPGALRDAQFLILAEDFLDSFGRYDELKFLLEHYEQVAKSNGQKPETVFQRFFEAHPELIQRDAFSAVFAKPTLRLPEAPGRFYQPDFVMKPRTGASVGTNWEILDLKLPDDPLVTSGAFHPAFSRSSRALCNSCVTIVSTSVATTQRMSLSHASATSHCILASLFSSVAVIVLRASSAPRVRQRLTLTSSRTMTSSSSRRAASCCRRSWRACSIASESTTQAGMLPVQGRSLRQQSRTAPGTLRSFQNQV